MMTLAKRLAIRSNRTHRHSSIVLKGGAIISTGYNHQYRHAEEGAINRLWPSKRIGTTVFNLRLKPSGRVGNAKPCKDCLAMMIANGVSLVLWTKDDGSIGRERL